MTTEVLIFILCLAVLCATSISILVDTLRTGSPPMPSSPALRREIIAMAAAAKAGEGVFYELGSGWGGLAAGLARAYPDRQVVGIERSLVPWMVSVIFQRLFGPSNLQFRRADFCRANLSDAALVLSYLSGETLGKAGPAIAARLPDGCAVVSAMFAWPGLVPEASAEARDLFRSPVYLYRVNGVNAG